MTNRLTMTAMFRLFAIAGSCGFSLRAEANVGLPAIALVWPAYWVLIVPIILIESHMAVRKLNVSWPAAAMVSTCANAVSTIAGVPLVWLAMMLMLVVGGGAIHIIAVNFLIGEYFDDEFYQMLSLVLFPLFSAWVVMAEYPGHIVFAMYFWLLTAMYFASVRIEVFIAEKMKFHTDRAMILDWAKEANFATYFLLVVFGGVYLWLN